MLKVLRKFKNGQNEVNYLNTQKKSLALFDRLIIYRIAYMSTTLYIYIYLSQKMPFDTEYKVLLMH